MDTFMDKLAQKLNAQDIIRANSAAEAAETERLKQEVEAYQQCLQEMKRLQQENAQANTQASEQIKEQVETLVNTTLEKIEAVKAEAGKQDELIELMKNQEDFTHKECVKVYRNVQASITEENGKQTEEILTMVKKAKNKATVAMTFGIVAVSLLVISILFDLLAYFSVLPF